MGGGGNASYVNKIGVPQTAFPVYSVSKLNMLLMIMITRRKDIQGTNKEAINNLTLLSFPIYGKGIKTLENDNNFDYEDRMIVGYL